MDVDEPGRSRTKPHTGKRHPKSIWTGELQDLVRGACGGFLFGIPLLYTMEVWWVGSTVSPPMMLGAIAAMVVVVFLLNRTEGFRVSRRVHRPFEALINTVEAIAIGLVCSTFMLILLQELTLSTHLQGALGKVIFESVPFTLGVALANHLLGDTRDPDAVPRSKQSNHHRNGTSGELSATLADIGATLIGAVVIAFNVAPTDEIPMLATAVSEPWLLAMIATSLLVSYGIVFEAGFSDQPKRRQQQGLFQHPLNETVLTYLISLLAAALMLFFFQKVSWEDPWTLWLRFTVLLGLPATIGGAAGRLAI